MKQKIEIFDTTLRDGTQGEGVTLSVRDKVAIALKLDEFGVDIIEGGWPGSNPKDEEFFREIKKYNLQGAKISAFGSTARHYNNIEQDPNLQAMLRAETEYVSMFGKTWRFHAEVGLGINEDQNAELIYNSTRFFVDRGIKVIFDAEHFFDGYKDDPKFAVKMLKAAEEAGACVLVLCDTNGGTMTFEIEKIINEVKSYTKIPLGIHAHNDCELAVANSLAAIKNGVTHIQGTFTGVGERCGNANLCSIIPNLIIKMNYQTKKKIDLTKLVSTANYISELMNIAPNPRAPYVGASAFAHKGGVHVSAVLKDSRMYEHISPSLVGAKQRVIVSDLSGQSNIKYKAKEFGVDLPENSDFAKRVVERIKKLEYDGYQFDGAEASFELLLRSETGEFSSFFKVLDAKIIVHFGENSNQTTADAVLKIQVDDQIEHTVSNGNGPVNALDQALRKALTRFYPEISTMKLVDYKVRVINESEATAAKVRVLIQSADGDEIWNTVGVSENIIYASWIALCDSINYKLFKTRDYKSLQKESIASNSQVFLR